MVYIHIRDVTADKGCYCTFNANIILAIVLPAMEEKMLLI